MISKNMMKLLAGNSMIRAMFEEGKEMAKKFGQENVYDFSLGNPSVEPPKEVKQVIFDILNEEDPSYVHGYMSNVGYEDVRDAIAKHLNKEYGVNYTQNNIVMTVGAAGGINVSMKALLNPGDEVIAFAPYFVEYNNYVGNYEGELVVVPPDTTTFMPNLEAFEELITAKTKAVIVNTPNNPTGVVYSAETLAKMGEILEKKQKEFGTSIYLFSDEPYRELVYGNIEVPFVPKYYRNTIVGYSYSKSLSLPGERIGYLVIPSEMDEYSEIFGAVGIATRILGFVNAPSLQQRVIGRCLDAKVDIGIYDRNRKLLVESLHKMGFECASPDGAFYLFIKTLEPDDKAFAKKAKKYNLLLVPGSGFACPGYVRLAYCVDYAMIQRSLPSFEKLAAEYK